MQVSKATTTAVHQRALRLMGNRFEISVVTEDKVFAEKCIDAAVEEIRQMEALLSTYKEDSQTNLINRNAGMAPVKVDAVIFQLIQRSIKLSQITQGAFDLTYGSIDANLWNFNKEMTSLPSAETARKLVRLINYRNILLDEKNGTVLLKEKGMRIGFGGIGKGCAADRAKLVLQQMGVESGIVNAAGDIITWGHQPNGQPWTIGIANPAAANEVFASVNITNKAIATSGNYEKFVWIGGKKYSHTIDPKTGLPVTGINSVTVISPMAEIADAMATPVMVMGIAVGLDLINQIKGLGCIIVDDNDKVYTSSNINIV